MTIFPSESSEIQSDEWKYDSIGGWLILVAIGLCVSPLSQLVFLLKDLLPIFTQGTWEVLTTQGSPAYHRLWAPVIVLEAVINLGFIVFEILLLFVMFKRKATFPRLMIAYLLVTFAFIALNYFVSQAIPMIAEQNDSQSRGSFIRSGLSCAIWIPYFYRSRRVKGTFRL